MAGRCWMGCFRTGSAGRWAGSRSRTRWAGTESTALVWVYSKDSGSESGSDRGWVDYLQWTPSAGGGSSTTDWQQITYTYDPSGRRIAKASVEMTTPASASSVGANDDSPLPQTGGLRGFIRRLPAS